MENQCCTVNVLCKECDRISEAYCYYGVIFSGNEVGPVLEGVCHDCLEKITREHLEEIRFGLTDEAWAAHYDPFPRIVRDEPERPA